MYFQPADFSIQVELYQVISSVIFVTNIEVAVYENPTNKIFLESFKVKLNAYLFLVGRRFIAFIRWVGRDIRRCVRAFIRFARIDPSVKSNLSCQF